MIGNNKPIDQLRGDLARKERELESIKDDPKRFEELTKEIGWLKQVIKNREQEERK